MSQHAKLSASAAHRWMACPGSVALSAGVARRGSANAAAGTLAHEIAAGCLNAGLREVPADSLGRIHKRDGFTVTCDQEMVDGVQMYLDHVRQGRQKGDQEFVEVDLTPALKAIDPEVGGTADFVRWRESEACLYVADFKYGAGVLVHPEGNKQLLLYALGALLAVGKPAKRVTVQIVQPRIEHEDGRVRGWTFKAADLLDFAADVAESAARTRLPSAELVPGDTQCQWCPAKHICPALEKKQHALMAVEFGNLAVLDPVIRGKTLDMLSLVEARIKAIREAEYQEAERGNPAAGWKLVAKRGVRRWADEEAVRTWAEQRAIDLFEDPKPKSPAQLEKGLTKDQKKELAEMTVTVSSGHTLAPEDDKRPAVHLALATEFAVIPGTAE